MAVRKVVGQFFWSVKCKYLNSLTNHWQKYKFGVDFKCTCTMCLWLFILWYFSEHLKSTFICWLLCTVYLLSIVCWLLSGQSKTSYKQSSFKLILTNNHHVWRKYTRATTSAPNVFSHIFMHISQLKAFPSFMINTESLFG